MPFRRRRAVAASVPHTTVFPGRGKPLSPVYMADRDISDSPVNHGNSASLTRMNASGHIGGATDQWESRIHTGRPHHIDNRGANHKSASVYAEIDDDNISYHGYLTTTVMSPEERFTTAHNANKNINTDGTYLTTPREMELRDRKYVNAPHSDEVQRKRLPRTPVAGETYDKLCGTRERSVYSKMSDNNN